MLVSYQFSSLLHHHSEILVPSQVQYFCLPQITSMLHQPCWNVYMDPAQKEFPCKPSRMRYDSSHSASCSSHYCVGLDACNLDTFLSTSWYTSNSFSQPLDFWQHLLAPVLTDSFSSAGRIMGCLHLLYLHHRMWLWQFCTSRKDEKHRCIWDRIYTSTKSTHPDLSLHKLQQHDRSQASDTKWTHPWCQYPSVERNLMLFE